METHFTTIEEVRSTLDRLRQDPKTQRNFPQGLWTSIAQLTKIYPIEEVCRRLQIKPIYLKRKIRQPRESTVQFHEIVPTPSILDTVTIELRSADGLQAKIQGPSSCLNYLNKLFGR